jgi:uncharacterized protein (TIGR02453 family)
MSFQGWPVEALEFLEGLEADNSKTYWQRNRSVYDTSVRAPMDALIEELAPEFGEGRIFRPYRDVRFSADKSPYKTHIAATIGNGYVQLSSGALAAGAGMWEMAPDQLERYREAVDAERTGRKLAGIVAAIRARGADVMGHGALKTAPKGYPKDHPRIELLRFKGIAAWHQWPAGPWLGKATSKDRVAALLRDAEPLNAWLRTQVGPTRTTTPR